MMDSITWTESASLERRVLLTSPEGLVEYADRERTSPTHKDYVLERSCHILGRFNELCCMLFKMNFCHTDSQSYV